MSDSPTAKIVELLGDQRTGMLTTISAEGSLHSRPMTIQRVDDDGSMMILLQRSSEPAQQIQVDDRLNLSFGSGSTWISVAGTGQISEDVALKQELWNPMVDAWFPDGPEDPNVAVLLVDAISGQYWDQPGGAAVTLFHVLKAKLTGGTADGSGENEKVDLS